MPHVYTARCSLLLDTDVYAHMNNASYLVHCELARWQMGAETGALRTMASEGLAFVVGSVAVTAMLVEAIPSLVLLCPASKVARCSHSL